MPTLKLTQATVDRLSWDRAVELWCEERRKKGKSVELPRDNRIPIWDEYLPAFGLLLSKPRRPGLPPGKAWRAVYRVRGSREQVNETLGNTKKYPKVGERREAARKSMAAAQSGINPVEQRRKAAEEAKKAEGKAFPVIAERYLTERVDKRSPSFARETRRIFNRDIIPRWRDRMIGDITSRDVNALLAAKADKRDRPLRRAEGGATVQSNRTHRRLNTFFEWAIRDGAITENPVALAHEPYEEKARDRYLGDKGVDKIDGAEIRAFWSGCDRLRWPYGPLFQLLLVTGQRLNEVAGAEWSELDLEARMWQFPGKRAKNAKIHKVALSSLAIEIIRTLPHVDDRFVFAGVRSSKPVCGFSSAKRRLDKMMPDSAHWLLHDLRRTMTTGCAELKVPPHIADKILNHVAGVIKGVMKTYQRYEFLDERRDALNVWGDYLAQLVGRNVVQYPARTDTAS
jgi:integrase